MECGKLVLDMLEKRIEKLPLKEMEGSLLSFAILDYAQTNDKFDIKQILKALKLASYLHRNQTRANRKDLPKDTYITHPYRNTLRLLRYGCESNDVIIASILHDTVEDHAPSIVKELIGETEPFSEEDLIKLSLGYISKEFNPTVAFIVEQVTNEPLPSHMSKDEKRHAYAKHVIAMINTPEAFLVKFSDFVDNAAGLHHNSGRPEMVAHLAKKYSLTVNAFDAKLNDPSFVSSLPIPADGISQMKEHLAAGKQRLNELQGHGIN